MKLDADLAQALTNLRNNQDFKVFVSHMSHDSEQLMERLVMTTDDATVPVLRGQARQMAHIMKAISDAPAALEKLRGKK